MSKNNLDNSVQTFGYKNYADYLASDCWRNFKEKYKNSTREQFCLKCGDPNFHLHHLTYDRICRERLEDVVPLCGDCHRREHELDKKDRLKIFPIKNDKPKEPKELPRKGKPKRKPRRQRFKKCLGCGGDMGAYELKNKCNRCRMIGR